MSLGEGEPSGAIYGDHEVPSEQTEGVQHLFPNQGFDHIDDDILYLAWVYSTKCRVEGITVWTGIHVVQGLKLGCGRPVATKQMGNLPPCSQTAQKHQYTGEHQGCQGVRDELRGARIVDLTKEFGEITKEVVDCSQKCIEYS